MTVPMHNLSRRQVLIAGGLTGAGVAAGAVWQSRGAGSAITGRRSGVAFGTVVTLKAQHHDQGVLDRALDSAWRELLAVEEAASLFRQASALSRLNREGVLADPPQVLVDMLHQAIEISRLTNGAFDASVQPLWGRYADAQRQGRLPCDAELAALRPLIGWQKIEMTRSRIRLTVPGMAMTLNGLAQGFATERCLGALSAHGIESAFLDTGEIGVAGRNDGGNPWTAAIADPRAPGAFVALAHPLDGVLATSGDYATTWTADFAAHHIIDPETLHSPQRLASVSVLTRNGGLADGLSTAMMVMGPELSLALARTLANVEVLMITKAGERIQTDGFPIA